NDGPAVLVTFAEGDTLTNSTLDDLVADLNGRLTIAGLGGQVVGSRGANNRIVFQTTTNGGRLKLGLRQFGVFVDAQCRRLDDNAVPDCDGRLDSDGASAPYPVEQTGLDRMLESENKPAELYGGTGVGFLFGNAGDDKLFRADGTAFESLDAG